MTSNQTFSNAHQTLSPFSSTASDRTLAGDGSDPISNPQVDINPRPRKRRRSVEQNGSAEPDSKRSSTSNAQMQPDGESAQTGKSSTQPAQAPSKSKRVRTGCLTCRTRHLKCDEGLPVCQNCVKSNRNCERGVRLNFIDTQVHSTIILGSKPAGFPDRKLTFQDESREIAAEYDGEHRYLTVEQTITPPAEQSEFPPHGMTAINTQMAQNLILPPLLEPVQGYFMDGTHQEASGPSSRHVSFSNSDSSYLPTAPPTANSNSDVVIPRTPGQKLTDPQEVLYYQIYVEEVALWMDSMDGSKQFSRVMPFTAMNDPMILHSFLACGAYHMHGIESEGKHYQRALLYYEDATKRLMKHLQNPFRDQQSCATAAVILNVYEIMSERPLQRMNHIAGARALVKECFWDAQAQGIGKACFWLNVGMEVLSCLHFNWQVAWKPDEWNLDMNFTRPVEPGNEEIWVHRTLYIIAKISTFRASTPQFQDPSTHDEQMRLQERIAQWHTLKNLCDQWNLAVPVSMQPLATLLPGQSIPSPNRQKSFFPEIWIIKRTAIVARLFYHTALVLLAQTNPLLNRMHRTSISQEMQELALLHAHHICGIVAHSEDRAIASVAIRSLGIASEVLIVRHEQEEALQILERIKEKTGWGIGFLHDELRQIWGWPSEKQALLQREADAKRIFGSSDAHPDFMQASLPPLPPPPPHTPLAVVGFSSLPPPPPHALLPMGIPVSSGGGGFGGGIMSVPHTLQPPMPIFPPIRPSSRAGGGVVGPNPLMRTADFSLPNHPYMGHYLPPIGRLVEAQVLEEEQQQLDQQQQDQQQHQQHQQQLDRQHQLMLQMSQQVHQRRDERRQMQQQEQQQQMQMGPQQQMGLQNQHQHQQQQVQQQVEMGQVGHQHQHQHQHQNQQQQEQVQVQMGHQHEHQQQQLQQQHQQQQEQHQQEQQQQVQMGQMGQLGQLPQLPQLGPMDGSGGDVDFLVGMF